MNNDKPASESSHSPQTKRERGLYHVKRNGYWTVAEYTDHHGQWRVFNNTDQMQSRDFEEIDERRIERGDSPTEQPGDSANKFNEAKWRIEYSKYSTYCNIIDADGYVGTIQGREKAELIAKAPEMAAELSKLRALNQAITDERNGLGYDLLHVTAERDELNSAIAHIWKALEITEYTGKHISEYVSKLRQENERYKEALQCMMNVEHHGDFMNAFFDLKDQVKAALQGE